jgi:CheY-like chemotaxis protein
MEALGILAGGMAHDFNNILQVIVGFTDLALAELAAGSSPVRSLDEVLKASDRARQLVKQVMSFSRRSEDVLQPLLLCPVVEESLRLLRSTLPSTVEIRSSICTKCGPISGNATLIQQVLLNLGANANQAMEEGGGVFEVTVQTMTVGADRARQHRNLREGEYVRMTVGDSGKGMDAATLERIFEPYFTTKERGEGTGLGLAVVHGIVNQLDGVITADSTPGAGTTFEILFPSLPHSPTTTDELTREDIQGGVESILIVDDEPQIVDATNLQLEQLGYRVTAVARSDEALRLIEAQPDAFDLLITDQTMPGMTGAELAERVQRIRPDLPVILCTGYDSALEDKYPEKPRIDALLAKPISRAELASAVRAALE